MFDNEKNIRAIRDEYYTNRIETTVKRLNRGGIKAYFANNKEKAIDLIIDLIENCLNYNREHYHKDGKEQIIGFGDSLTLHEINLFESIYDRYGVHGGSKTLIINPFERLDNGSYVEFKGLGDGWIDADLYNAAYLRVMEKMRQCLLSDVFITSANAITINGKIISTDGVGNRLAGVIFGPYKVIIVIGRNKIVDTEEDAFSRIKNFTTPVNHLRHAKLHSRRNEDGSFLEKDSLFQLSKLPCVLKGHCMDCGAPNCSRRVTMTMSSATGGSLKDRLHVVIINEDLGL